MANQWYVLLNGQEVGPLSQAGLERLVYAGRIVADTPVRNRPEDKWAAAHTVPGLLANHLGSQASPTGAAPAATTPPAAPRLPDPPPVRYSPRPSQPAAAGSAPQPVRSIPGPPPPASARAPVVSSSAADSTARAILPRVGGRQVLGAVAVWGAAFLAAWTAARVASSHAGPSAAAGSGGDLAQLAELKRETDSLRQELLATKRQFDDLRAPSSGESPAPPTADLAAERQALAEAIARDWANREDAAARLRYDLSHVIDPAIDAVRGEPYKSQSEEFYQRQLPEVERELADAGAAQLARRRQEFESGQSKARQESRQLFADAKSAIKGLDLARADQLLKRYLASGHADRHDAAVELLRDMLDATPVLIDAAIGELSPLQRRELISTGRLPAAWPHECRDPDLAEAVRQMAVRLAPVGDGLVQTREYLERGLAQENAYDLAPARTLKFLADAAELDKEHDLTAARVGQLVDAYGFFSVADIAPQIDRAITFRLNREIKSNAREALERLARGEIKFASLGDLFAECRNMAGARWPADGARLPYSGHWVSRSKWHLYIDPWRETIVFRRSSPAATYKQRICKLAPESLAAYERHVFGAVKPLPPADQSPFSSERFDESKDAVPEMDGPNADELVALTLYVCQQGDSKTLRLYRRYKNPTASLKLEELKGHAFWKSLGDKTLYRGFKDVYRFVDDKLAPE